MEIIPHKLFGNIRVILVDEVPWFCARDVARALGYEQPHRAIKRHVNESQKCVYETLSATIIGGTAHPPADLQPHTLFVSEPGLYSLVMASKMPNAVEFKDWVCAEVLPTIRKYGTYTCWKEISNEYQLHCELMKYARAAYAHVRISPGLGEMQDSAKKRLECYYKGYQKGQPDLIVHQRSGNFSGLVIELKTPTGKGVISNEQRQWLDDMAYAGYRVVVCNSLEESIRQLNTFMHNARVCCRHCGRSFASDKTLCQHVFKFHPS